MNIRQQYENALSCEQKHALKLCGDFADYLGTKIYIVGGIVRDILLGRSFNDIDILIEYDGILYAELLERKYKNEIEIFAKNDKFLTAKVKFKIKNKEFEADIASTRSEVYEYPSALPILAETGVSLKKDISRRDFTVNSLAMSLNSETFGDIYDETDNGINDLENGLIRILHPDSFMDDPSRIIRSLKYRTKLGFELEYDTGLIEQECLNSNKYSDNCQERIKKEVIETLNLFSPYCFDKFLSENIYKLVISKISRINIPSGDLICEIINNSIENIDRNNIWLIFLCVLFANAPLELVGKNTEKLALTRKEQDIITDFFLLNSSIDKIDNLQNNYDIYTFFEQYAAEAIIANQCLLKSTEAIERIYLYFKKLKNVKLSVSGKDIEKYGIENGVVYKEILNTILKEKMNNSLSVQDEKTFFKAIIKSYIN